MSKKHVDRTHDELLIGLSIREARVSARVTQSRLASAIGVTYQQVQNYEKGSARISASTLKAVAEFLGAPISSFFDMPDGAVGEEAIVQNALSSISSDTPSHGL